MLVRSSRTGSSSGRGRIAGKFEAGRQLGQQPCVVARARHARQPRHGGLEHAIQGRVLGQFVKPAGKAVGPDSVTGELSSDVETPTQQPQVLLARDIAPGKAMPHGSQQPGREQVDEDFQQVVRLPRHAGKRAVGHPQVMRHSQHLNKCMAHGVGLAVDLGQDFEGTVRNGKNAYDLLRFQAAPGADQHASRAPFQLAASAFGQRMELSGLSLGQPVLANLQFPPFPADQGFHGLSLACVIRTAVS